MASANPALIASTSKSHPVTLLCELTALLGLKPTYEVTESRSLSGKLFNVRVKLCGDVFVVESSSFNKKQAKFLATHSLLCRLSADPSELFANTCDGHRGRLVSAEVWDGIKSRLSDYVSQMDVDELSRPATENPVEELSALMRLAQKDSSCVEYLIEDRFESDQCSNCLRYECFCRIGEVFEVRALGNSKKISKRNAAMKAIDCIERLSNDKSSDLDELRKFMANLDPSELARRKESPPESRLNTGDLLANLASDPWTKVKTMRPADFDSYHDCAIQGYSSWLSLLESVLAEIKVEFRVVDDQLSGLFLVLESKPPMAFYGNGEQFQLALDRACFDCLNLLREMAAKTNQN